MRGDACASRPATLPFVCTTWHTHLRTQLNTFGFVGFMFNAIMSFRVCPCRHQTSKVVHFLLHTIAFGCSVTAVVLMFKFHNANGIPNMYSTHSVVGMAALVMFGTQWLLGLCSFLLPMTPQWMRFMAMPFHKFLGVGILVMTSVACVLGAFDRQRITYEVGPLSVPYTAVTDKWANGYAMCVLASAFMVALVLHEASEKLRRPHDVEMANDTEYSKLADQRAPSSHSANRDYATHQ